MTGVTVTMGAAAAESGGAAFFELSTTQPARRQTAAGTAAENRFVCSGVIGKSQYKLIAKW